MFFFVFFFINNGSKQCDSVKGMNYVQLLLASQSIIMRSISRFAVQATNILLRLTHIDLVMFGS